MSAPTPQGRRFVAALATRATSWLRDPYNALLLLVGLFVVCAAAAAPMQRKGDASEYILVTESLVYDRDLVYSEHVDLRRHAMKRPEGLSDVPGGLTTLRGQDGLTRFGLHSFYYSLAAAPFYLAFGYHGFYVLNALCFFVTIAAVYGYASRRVAKGGALLFACAATFLSAAWAYVFFTQTEAFYTALLAVFLYFWFTGRPKRAAVAAGVVFGAQLPLAAFFLPFGFDLARRRDFKGLALCTGIVLACMAPQAIYNAHFLGTLAPMKTVGLADVRFIDADVVLRTLFDPSMGVFFFYPITVYCLVNARYTARSVLLLTSSLLVVLGMNTVHNVYSHQIGVRFGNYLLPVFLFLVDRLDVSTTKSRLAIAFTVFAGAGLALDPLGNSSGMNVHAKAYLPYALVSRLPFYRDNPEVFRSSALRLGSAKVHGQGFFPDRWTRGGEDATLLVEGVTECPLSLEIGTWGLDSPQSVVIETASGEVSSITLPQRTPAAVTVQLGQRDLLRYRRWPDAAYTLIKVRAEPWTPAWSTADGGHDRRRLGVRLLSITCGDRTLLMTRDSSKAR